MKAAPIVIADDDNDDNEFLKAAWEELGFENPLVFFQTGEQVLEYLKTEKLTPFMILSDVNLPKMDGFELKEKLFMDSDLKYVSIPFIFWSTTASEAQIKKAYDLGGNGFFIKGSSFESIKNSLVGIVKYWTESKVPLEGNN